MHVGTETAGSSPHHCSSHLCEFQRDRIPPVKLSQAIHCTSLHIIIRRLATELDLVGTPLLSREGSSAGCNYQSIHAIDGDSQTYACTRKYANKRNII